MGKGKAMKLTDCEKVHGYLIEYAYAHQSELGFRWGDIIKYTPRQVSEILAKMPNIEPKTAHWIGEHTPFRCSNMECGHYSDSKTPYCPYCGKKMGE